MKEFPNKILLSQYRESKEILDFWCLNDFTDNITKEYVQLDKDIDVNSIDEIEEHINNYKFKEKDYDTRNNR